MNQQVIQVIRLLETVQIAQFKNSQIFRRFSFKKNANIISTLVSQNVSLSTGQKPTSQNYVVYLRLYQLILFCYDSFF